MKIFIVPAECAIRFTRTCMIKQSTLGFLLLDGAYKKAPSVFKDRQGLNRHTRFFPTLTNLEMSLFKYGQHNSVLAENECKFWQKSSFFSNICNPDRISPWKSSYSTGHGGFHIQRMSPGWCRVQTDKSSRSIFFPSLFLIKEWLRMCNEESSFCVVFFSFFQGTWVAPFIVCLCWSDHRSVFGGITSSDESKLYNTDSPTTHDMCLLPHNHTPA